MSSLREDGSQTAPSGPLRAVQVVAATVAALIGGSVPCLIFWFMVRHADGTYPAGSEALVMVAAPFLAGLVFALFGSGPILRRAAGFAAALAVPLALVTILVIYNNDLDGLGPAPLAAIAAWALFWIIGFVGAAIGARVRKWAAKVRATSLAQTLREWWARRTCPHNWELVEKQGIPGRPLGRPALPPLGVAYHFIYIYRCPICGAVKAKSDRWGPAS